MEEPGLPSGGALPLPEASIINMKNLNIMRSTSFIQGNPSLRRMATLPSACLWMKMMCEMLLNKISDDIRPEILSIGM
ncbi:hypothetical protein D3C71_1761820 [compost metagenome]